MLTLYLFVYDENSEPVQLAALVWTGLPIPESNHHWTWNGVACLPVSRRVTWKGAQNVAGDVMCNGRVDVTLLPEDQTLHRTRWWEPR